MSRMMQRMMLRYMDENDGEGSDLGGTEPTAEGPAGDSGGTATPPAEGQTGGSSGEPADPDAPKSMQEAIEKGLDKLNDAKPQGEQPPAKAGEQKPAGDQPPAAKPEDLTQMPEGLSAKAQQRFTGLVSALKEKDAEIATIRQQAEEGQQFRTSFQSVIKDTGATNEQLQEAFVFLKAANSGDYQTVVNILTEQLREASLAMGKPIENLMDLSDPLQAYPDLKQAVESYQISTEAAHEIAKHRARDAQQQAQQRVQQEQQQGSQDRVQQWVREKDATMSQLGQITANLAKTDPLYPVIEAQIMKNTDGLQTLIRDTPPNTWIPQFNLLYSQIKAVIQSQAPSRAGGPRPLSGGGGKPSGTVPAPKTMYDAIFNRG